MVRINEDDPDAEQLIVSKTYTRRLYKNVAAATKGEEGEEEKEEEEGEEEEIVTHYIKGRFIGKGAFGHVYEFRCLENGQVYAGKVISKASVTTGAQKRKLITEIRIHRRLSHPNVVRFVQSFTDEDNYYIVLELCRHRTLLDVLRCRGRLPEGEARYWLAQLLRALFYLRGVLVLHRDLKLGNLFVCDGMVLKVGDFGLSASLATPADRKRSICGTPNYIAPEVLAPEAGHGLEADVWAFGIIAYTLLAGVHPFEVRGGGPKETYARIRSGEYDFPASVSPAARDLIQHILVRDPAARYTLDQVAAHPFFAPSLIPASLPVHALVTDPELTFIPPLPEAAPPVLSEERAQALPRPRPRHRQGGDTTAAKTTTITTTAAAANGAEITAEPYVPPSGIDELRALKHAVLYALDATLETQGAPYTPVPRASVPGLGTPRNDRVATVRRWVDYSQLYGLGYLLSNGSVGAYYNDTSKILLTRKRRWARACGGGGEALHRSVRYICDDTLIAYRTDADGETTLGLSHDRLKKLRIANDFRAFLCDPSAHPRCALAAPPPPEAVNGDEAGMMVVADEDAEGVEVFGDEYEEDDAEVVMVTHYYKVADGIIFRFSNGSMQINYQSKVRLLVVPWWKSPVRFLSEDSNSNSKGGGGDKKEEKPLTAEAQRECVMGALHALNKLIKRYTKPKTTQPTKAPLKEIVGNNMPQEAQQLLPPLKEVQHMAVAAGENPKHGRYTTTTVIPAAVSK